MNLAVQLIEMVLPVLVMIMLGAMCRKRQIITQEGIEGLKSVISNITLPVILFNAFFTATYTIEVLIIFIFVFISCGVALGIGFWARRFVKPYEKFSPFLMTNFEGGMLGYTLFGLLVGSTALSTFAMVDIGQTVFAYTVYLFALKTVGGSQVTPKEMLDNMIKSPPCVGMFTGIILGLLGVHKLVMNTVLLSTYHSVVQFISVPTAGMILIVMGYQLSVKKTMIKPVCRTVGIRFAVMLLLFLLCSFGIFYTIPWNKNLQVALMLMFSLPAPFIIPLFVDVEGDGEYISTTLSVSIIVTVVMFCIICFYSMYL